MLGILWSSFSKYYFFNTTAHWGIWHDEIYLYELFELPLPEELSGNIADHVIALVKQLRNYKPDTIDILHPSGVSEEKAHAQRRKWEHELDEAVIDLYHFTEHQRCLIHDCCDIAIPFFYEPYNSVGNKPVIENGNTDWIKNYAACFADYWQPYLEKTEALRADTCIALSDNIIVLEFYIAEAGDVWDLVPKEKLWQSILTQIEDALPTPIGTSTILVDGIVQIVTDDSIIIIKRNEKIFWTKSIAYEDAESTMTKRILGNTTKTRSAK